MIRCPGCSAVPPAAVGVQASHRAAVSPRRQVSVSPPPSRRSSVPGPHQHQHVTASSTGDAQKLRYPPSDTALNCPSGVPLKTVPFSCQQATVPSARSPHA